MHEWFSGNPSMQSDVTVIAFSRTLRCLLIALPIQLHDSWDGTQWHQECSWQASAYWFRVGPGWVGSHSSRSMLNTLLYIHPLNDGTPTCSLYVAQLASCWLAPQSPTPAYMHLWAVHFVSCGSYFLFFFSLAVHFHEVAGFPEYGVNAYPHYSRC